MAQQQRQRRRQRGSSVWLRVVLCMATILVLTVQGTATGSSDVCEPSEWSSWSTCPCGGGLKTRSRQMVSGDEVVCAGTEFTQAQHCTGDGSSECHAAVTCLGLLQEHPATPSGVYWITGNFGRKPFRAYCDMVTDGGGWTLVYANSAHPDATPAQSWDELMSNPPGIDVDGEHGFDSPMLVGALNINLFENSKSLMARDIGNWQAGEYSMVQFQFTQTLQAFVHHTIHGTQTGKCTTLPSGERFVFRNSNGVKYAHNELRDTGGGGYGWGDCNPPVQGTNTATSDVEDAPVHWIFHRGLAGPAFRVAGVGGANGGDSSVIARVFVRFDHVDVDCEVGPWSVWSACTTMCSGTRARTRAIVTSQSGNGKVCPNLEEKQPCNQHIACEGFCPVCTSVIGAATAADTPCHHRLAPHVCYPTYTGSLVCPSGTQACTRGKGELGTDAEWGAGDPGDLCSGCWPGTRGECQQANTVCFSAAVTQFGTKVCPTGTERCSFVGSRVPEPRVIVDIELAGISKDDFDDTARTLYKTKLAAAAGGLPPGNVVIESVVGTSAASPNVIAVGSVVVTPSASQIKPDDAAGAITASVTSGNLVDDMNHGGLPVQAAALNTGQAVVVDVDDPGRGNSQTPIQYEPPSTGGAGSNSSSDGLALGGIGILAVAGVAVLLILSSVAVVVRRQRSARRSDQGFEPNKIMIPRKPAYLPDSRFASFSSVRSTPSTLLTSPDRNLFLEDGSSGDDWDVEQVTTITDASEVMAKWESISPRPNRFVQRGGGDKRGSDGNKRKKRKSKRSKRKSPKHSKQEVTLPEPSPSSGSPVTLQRHGSSSSSLRRFDSDYGDVDDDRRDGTYGYPLPGHSMPGAVEV